MVTGASRGLGLQIIESLVTGGFSPGKIIATARNPDGAKVMLRADSRSPICIRPTVHTLETSPRSFTLILAAGEPAHEWFRITINIVH